MRADLNDIKRMAIFLFSRVDHRGSDVRVSAQEVLKRNRIACVNRQQYAESTAEAAGAVGLAASWALRLAMVRFEECQIWLAFCDATR